MSTNLRNICRHLKVFLIFKDLRLKNLLSLWLIKVYKLPTASISKATIECFDFINKFFFVSSG